MKQTAVEWLIDKIFMTDFETFNFLAENGDFYQAKAMEKEQIKDAYGDGLNAHRTDFCNRDEYYQKNYKEDKQ